MSQLIQTPHFLQSLNNIRSMVTLLLQSIALMMPLLFSLSVVAKAPMFIPAPPEIAAKSYVLIDAVTGDIIIEKNADLPLPPASLTKIMTSYVAAHELSIGKLTLQDQVLISIKAWRKGGSKMYIREGQHVSFDDLLKGIIIQSGNDASIAVAEHIAGSEDAFAQLMNMHAQTLGMTNTHFANATGWPAEGHLTTAKDLSLLTRELINQFPDHYSLYREKSFTYNNIKQPNRNLLLWRDASVDGVKTGHTEEAGYCLVSSAEREGMRLIAVVMGTNSTEARASESLKLLNYGFRFYHTHTAYYPNQTIHESPIWMGQQESFTLGIDQEIKLTLPRGHEANLTAEVTLDPIIKAPIEQGDALGTLTLTLNNETILEKPLVALESVDKAGLFKRFWHWLKLLFASLF